MTKKLGSKFLDREKTHVPTIFSPKKYFKRIHEPYNPVLTTKHIVIDLKIQNQIK